MLNVDHGAAEAALFAAFYGEGLDSDNAGWREIAIFSSCVLRPQEVSGKQIHT